jgi:hypothetical protein
VQVQDLAEAVQAEWRLLSETLVERAPRLETVPELELVPERLYLLA